MQSLDKHLLQYIFVEWLHQLFCNPLMHRAYNTNTKHASKYKMFLWPWKESYKTDPAAYRLSPDWQSHCSTSTNACVEGGACEHNGWIQTAWFGVRWNDSKPCVTLEPIMRNTHKPYILCLVPWVSLRKQKHWKLKNRKRGVWAMNPA